MLKLLITPLLAAILFACIATRSAPESPVPPLKEHTQTTPEGRSLLR